MQPKLNEIAGVLMNFDSGQILDHFLQQVPPKAPSPYGSGHDIHVDQKGTTMTIQETTPEADTDDVHDSADVGTGAGLRAPSRCAARDRCRSACGPSPSAQ